MKEKKSRWDLQAKISLVLVSVILPTFALITLVENEFTGPILEDEIRQLGIHAAKTLAAEIDSARMLTPLATNGASAPRYIAVENAIQETMDGRPDLLRIDVAVREPITGLIRTIASNFEEDPSVPSLVFPVIDAVQTEFRRDAQGVGSWEILVPIEHYLRYPRLNKKFMGVVHVVVSTKMVGHIISTLWKFKAVAASFSVISLILILSYFLRKTIANDRLLRLAENQNVHLSQQLHEAHRELMLTEKLAVMGQLTANFAHELGTPLNAIGGHLQLLRRETAGGAEVSVVQSRAGERLNIVEGQLLKIEAIVQGFLQSTAKPTSQKQLVDLNALIEKTIQILMPRIQSLDVRVVRNFFRGLGPMRVVPLDVEQVFLNLFSNSLDSLKSKNAQASKLELSTRVVEENAQEWVQIAVWDNGSGITKEDLRTIPKPFYTTKRVGEGTGLGLAICQQIIHKYGGRMSIDSKYGFWTRVVVSLPYQSEGGREPGGGDSC